MRSQLCSDFGQRGVPNGCARFKSLTCLPAFSPAPGEKRCGAAGAQTHAARKCRTVLRRRHAQRRSLTWCNPLPVSALSSSLHPQSSSRRRSGSTPASPNAPSAVIDCGLLQTPAIPPAKRTLRLAWIPAFAGMTGAVVGRGVRSASRCIGCKPLTCRRACLPRPAAHLHDVVFSHLERGDRRALLAELLDAECHEIAHLEPLRLLHA